jgi:hypothetical protein
MVHPQVLDGGDSLQIWRVAAKISNKQLQTADREWPSSLGVRQGLTTLPLHKKKSDLLQNVQKAPKLVGLFHAT